MRNIPKITTKSLRITKYKVSPLAQVTITRHLSLPRSSPPASFPVIQTCPSPTCSCAATPTGLDIDRTTPLTNTTPAYHEHVVVCTGKENWTSRIEDEEGPNLAKALKELIGRGGKLHDPFHNVMITNSSFPSEEISSERNSVYLFPSFRYVPHFYHRGLNLLEASTQLHLLRDDQSRGLGGTSTLSQDVTEVVVLICGHGGRDVRCGITGPILRSAFKDSLEQIGGTVCNLANHTVMKPSKGFNARVGLVSHIGGHKFAGNVIVYIPPGFGPHRLSPLAGKGIWYGRVEPRHVEGIVQETILRGNVIEELFRGGVAQGGEMLRL